MTSSSRHGWRKVSPRSLAVFTVLWLLVGYSLGTSTLLGPVRWLASFVRSQNLAQWLENAGVVATISALVVVSALASLVLTTAFLRSPRWDVKLGIPLLAVLAAGGALWLWMKPELVAADVPIESPAGSRFSYGPYPDEERMEVLKEEGFTAIVSLLHPAVVPFEPVLLAQEKEASRRVGIELIHLPMLPWVSDNVDSLKAVQKLAEIETGRYYVHCYLGKDRVNVVRRVAGDHSAQPPPANARELKHGLELERGALWRLEDGVFIMGFPSDEEFFAYIVGAGVRQVVSLLDPDTARNRQWIERERRLLATYEVPFAEIPLSNERPDCARIKAAVARVRQMPRPVVVHQFLSPSTGRAPMAATFVEEYLRALPPPAEDPRLLDRSLPQLRTVILLGPVLLLAVWLIAAWVGWLRVHDDVRASSTRNLFHGLMFSFAGALYLFGGPRAAILLAALLTVAMLYTAYRGPGFDFFEALAQKGGHRARGLVVLAPLAAAALGGVTGSLISVAIAPLDSSAVAKPHRLSHGLKLERGTVVELEEEVFLTGYPTDKEFLRYFATGGVRQVVSLLDAASPENRERITRERRFLASCGIGLTEMPLQGADRETIRAAVARIASMPRPLVVHDFLAPSTGRAPTARVFVEEYKDSFGPFYLRFFERALPEAREVVTLGPFLLLGILLAAFWVGRLRIQRQITTPYTRKVFHFVIFTLAGALHIAGGLSWVTLFGGLVALVVLFAAWRGDGFPFYEAIARPSDHPHRTLFVLVPLATTVLGGVAANLLFEGFAQVGYLVSGWGDAVAEPVGTRWGKHPYRVPSLAGVPAKRTWEGSAAVLVVGSLGAAVALAASGVSPLTALWVGAVCGVAAAAVEAVSHHGTDNFTIQVAATGVAYLLLA